MTFNGVSEPQDRSVIVTQVATADPRPQTDGQERRTPVWNEQDRALVVEGIVLHEFPQRATKLTWLLAFFEEQQWSQEWFDDPLPGTENGDAPQRLKDAVRALNECQCPQMVRFRTRNKFTQVRWQWFAS